MKPVTSPSRAMLPFSHHAFSLIRCVLISSVLISYSVQAAPPPDKTPPAPAFEPVPTKRTTGLENTPIRTKPLSSNVVGTLTPVSGKWHTFVTVKGPNFAKAERVSVTWYPNDDDSKTASGSFTATLRKRVGTDELEIEMPRDAGGASGGIVRVYVFMPNQLQPVLAGRFTVMMDTAPPAEVLPTTPILITTPPLKMTDKRPVPEVLPTTPILITTAPLKMTGKRPVPEVLPTTPILITTAPLKMTGKRPVPEVLPTTPILITTPPLKMTGKRPALHNVPPPKQGPIMDRTLRTLP